MRFYCTICQSDAIEDNSTGGIATIECYTHRFHNTCIIESSQHANTCPNCRKRCYRITNSQLQVQEVVHRDQSVPSDYLQPQGRDQYSDSYCLLCMSGDNEATLLLCDQCDAGYYTQCIGLDDQVPAGDWFCPCCIHNALERNDLSTSPSTTTTTVTTTTTSSNMSTNTVSRKDLTPTSMKRWDRKRSELASSIVEQCQSITQQELDNDIKQWSKYMSKPFQSIMQSNITENECIRVIKTLNNGLSSTIQTNRFRMREAAARGLYYLNLTEIHRARRSTTPLEDYLKEKTDCKISTINEYKQFGKLVLKCPEVNLAAANCTWEQMKSAMRFKCLEARLYMVQATTLTDCDDWIDIHFGDEY